MPRARCRASSGCAATPCSSPRRRAAPVQVLGVLESAGLAFDALWLAGMTDEAWPLAARPNPFLAPALQKKAGIPEASAESALALDRRITEGWLAAAPEVVVSHPAWEEDRKLVASPLFSGIAVAPTPESPAPRWRDLVFAARASESAPDGKAPALATKTPRGGTRILADQAACPFRAFARHRLAAEALEEPARRARRARARAAAARADARAVGRAERQRRARGRLRPGDRARGARRGGGGRARGAVRGPGKGTD